MAPKRQSPATNLKGFRPGAQPGKSKSQQQSKTPINVISKSQELFRERKWINLIQYGAEMLTKKISEPEKLHLAKTMTDVSNEVAWGQLDTKTQERFQTLQRNTFHVYFLMAYYGLSSIETLLHEATTILSNAPKTSNGQSKPELEQQKMQVSIKLMLHPSKHAQDEWKLNNERPIRDFAATVWDTLPPGIGVHKTAYLDFFYETFESSSRRPVTESDERFINRVANSENEEVYHKAIALLLSYDMSVSLGKRVFHRLFHSIEMFESIVSKENLEKEMDHEGKETMMQAAWLPAARLSLSNAFDVAEKTATQKVRHRYGIGRRESRTSFRKCGRCERYYYCSEACQKSHWEEKHRSFCRVKGEFRKGDAVCIHGIYSASLRHLNSSYCTVESVVDQVCTVALPKDINDGLLDIPVANLYFLFSAKEWQQLWCLF
ncbi:hypothetical protein BCR33DRAFT_719305 [Rhizoclosmatium globosum]|uniref:MYND-type domain-containing protein n=1 Tax=Rhizoclosmatium globosum TaxID=329046 RepID=A0A1Y2C178_9FUNG|nr:hypothetical protein BCR33DRAFT_719305 [Rhizoclosmatium globosum]|eukprot:ORY40780.1 hypothetical protein BCR33DRAFT_719305 [Rhizoclosmatium globosum]